jgi:hypothetical protein
VGKRKSAGQLELRFSIYLYLARNQWGSGGGWDAPKAMFAITRRHQDKQKAFIEDNDPLNPLGNDEVMLFANRLERCSLGLPRFAAIARLDLSRGLVPGRAGQMTPSRTLDRSCSE